MSFIIFKIHSVAKFKIVYCFQTIWYISPWRIPHWLITWGSISESSSTHMVDQFNVNLSSYSVLKICDVTCQNQTNVAKNKMLSYGIMEQVCDLSFHMKFYLRLYANRIKSYTDRNKV